MQIFKKIMKYLKILYILLIYFTCFTVCSGDIKKNSENDQSAGHFQSFFPSPDPKSERKNPVNQLMKRFWPNIKLTDPDKQIF